MPYTSDCRRRRRQTSELGVPKHACGSSVRPTAGLQVGARSGAQHLLAAPALQLVFVRKLSVLFPTVWVCAFGNSWCVLSDAIGVFFRKVCGRSPGGKRRAAGRPKWPEQAGDEPTPCPRARQHRRSRAEKELHLSRSHAPGRQGARSEHAEKHETDLQRRQMPAGMDWALR